MSRDVGEELREVQPPQELHWVRVGAVTHAARGKPMVEREGERQWEGENRPRVKVSSTTRGSHRTATAPTESSPDQKVLPLRVHVDG